MRIARSLVLLIIVVRVSAVGADDWPGWLGPGQASVWRETGIVEQFPAGGLKVRWRTPVDLGYAGPAVCDGRVFVMDYVPQAGEVKNNPGGVDRLQGTERVMCLDAESGRLVWKHQYDRSYEFSYGGGPRCTPSVIDNRVYALGAEGNLWCLDAADGRVVWSRDFVADYGAKTPYWGVAAHPLVVGDTVFCLVGGEGSVAVAFDKDSGREIWRALSAPDQGYCPPTMIEHAGRQQLLIWHAESLNALDPATGRLVWSVPLKPAYGMSIAAPRKIGPYIFASGYGDTGALLRLAEDASEAQVVWRGRPKTAVYCANSTPFLEQSMIYGCDVDSGALMGVRLQDGERLWETMQPTTGGTRRARYGTAFLVKHAERFFLFSETGDLILARLSPEGYEEIGRYHILEPTSQTFGRPVVWSHPAFAQRCMFARNDKELVCVDLTRQ
jgi:outer membrane protein assembly factor BamB